VPVDSAKFAAILLAARRHIAAIQGATQRQLADLVFYEFGAGIDLIIPLSFYSLGVEHQILVDIRRLASPDLINDTIRKLQRSPPDVPLRRRPGTLLSMATLAQTLRSQYGIDYRAPSDAQNTALPPKSIDCVTSTNTLEHIPPHEIEKILTECHRILRDDGHLSMQIDYQDHYSYFDHGISAYNFLRYSESAWSWFSPSLHYQNRLRHSDYLLLFEGAGFKVVDQSCTGSNDQDRQTLAQLRLSEPFRRYSPADLAIRSSFLLLAKRG
jgi:SAM-dependent methyltransferase